MNFAFSTDQRMLADGVRDFLAGQCSVHDVQRAWDEGPSDARWKGLAAMGVVGLLVPEAQGGMGMDEVDLTLILEEVGWFGLPEPLGEVAAVAVPLLVATGGEVAEGLLSAIAAGEVRVLPALDADQLPSHLASADHILVQRGSEVHLVNAVEVDLIPAANVDGARPTSTFVTTMNDTTAIDFDAGPALRAAADRGAWAASAQLVGCGRRLIDLATEHAQQREQFGQPIGSFQAVKHRLASALVAVEFARPLVHRAACSIGAGDPQASLHASMAKAVAAEAAQDAAKAALQVHGAIGYTWEHHLHLFMKRVWSLSASWGSTESHWQAIEAGAS